MNFQLSTFNFQLIFVTLHPLCCPDGGIGRHEGLKIPWPNSRTGSSPVPGTDANKKPRCSCNGASLFIVPPKVPPHSRGGGD